MARSLPTTPRRPPVKWIASLRPKAIADLQDAHDWYEARCPGLGAEFLSDLADALSRMEADPGRCPIYYQGFRRVLAHRFPYKIFYRIAGQHLIVFRILHGAQDHPRQLRP